MNVELHINGQLACSIPTERSEMEKHGDWIISYFNLEMLKRFGVEAVVMITGVESKMNLDGFIIEDICSSQVQSKARSLISITVPLFKT